MPRTSVLVVHNSYQQSGGEDAVVRAEIEELRRRGHRVITYLRQNAEIAGYGALKKTALALTATWQQRTYSEMTALIRAERPDVAHVHNFFPLISPAAHYACNGRGVPVVQTLHNYRLLCPAATLFADGERCRRCRSGMSPAIRHACYRNSRAQTAAVSAMISAHRALGSWDKRVDAYLTPSRFCRDYFVDSGLSHAKVQVRPNFLARDPGPRTGHGNYALFVGRLTAEKGVLEMVRAWQQLPSVPLRIAGDGPLRSQVQAAAEQTQRDIQLLGQLSREQTIACLKAARFLIFPSRWYEPFGMALLEAAACGLPAIASRIGGIPELVLDRQTGFLFDPDNFDELVEQVRWAWSHPAETDEMGCAARQHYLANFTSDASYEALMRVWSKLPR